MKIIVNYINGDTVQFSSEYGIGNGKWMDGKPQIDREYFVEFEIRDTLGINEIREAESERFFLEVVNGNNLLTMRLIDYEDTGCASFIFGDSIVDIVTRYDDSFFKLKNKYLSFLVGNLYIYSIDF